MKNSYYFSHDFNARNDVKLQEVLMQMGQEGMGIYWSLVEMMYEQGGKLEYAKCDSIAFALRTDSEKVKQLINIIFESEGNYFWSNSVISRLKMQKSKSNKAKQSAQKRWTNQSKPINANAMRTQSDGNAIKEKKVNESKVKEIEMGEASINYLFPLPTLDIEEFAQTFKCTPGQVQDKAISLMDYCQSKNKKYSNYKAFLRNALRKDFGVRPDTKPNEASKYETDDEGMARLKGLKSGFKVKGMGN